MMMGEEREGELNFEKISWALAAAAAADDDDDDDDKERKCQNTLIYF
jgi:hypothetical protein